MDSRMFSSLFEVAGNMGEGSRIALLDTGVDPSHPDFTNADIICGDLIDPRGAGRDIDGHGTSCAGIILSVAPRCTLLSGRILDRSGSFTYDALISGLYWAGARKADIICICSGARHPDPLAETKLRELAVAGCITIAAVGNHGKEGQGAGVFPARSPGCLAIGTANEAGELSFFTNLPEGKEVYCVQGEEFQATTLNGSHHLVTGTSASAALVAGVLGLWVGTGRSSKGAQKGHILKSASAKRSSVRGNYMLIDLIGLLSQAP